MTGSATVETALLREIRARGPITFARFQEIALYGEGGYYEASGRVGREGDFVTGASWHPAFARCLLRFLRKLEGLEGEHTALLDVGCGEGELLRFVEAAGPAGIPDLIGVERSAVRRGVAEASVRGARFHPSLEDVAAPVAGLILAYELFDALPARVFRVEEDGSLVERLVDEGPGGTFIWTEAPARDGPQVASALERRGVVLHPGHRIETRPGTEMLSRRLGAALARGAVLVFDYGAPARALYGPTRPGGTLEAFTHHQVTREVLTEPGTRDLTTWVDFDAIAEGLRAAGCDVAGPVSQSRFLLGNGIAAELPAVGSGGRVHPAQLAERNAVAKLFLPGGMGESMRLLIATRDSTAAAVLAAFPEV